MAALLVAGVALKEGRDSWRGENCCTTPIIPGETADGCDDDCCR